MFPRVCECSVRCSAYFDVWLLCIKERLCSLNLFLKLKIDDVLFGMKIDSRAALFVSEMSVLVTANNLSELQTSSTSILNYGVNGLQ